MANFNKIGKGGLVAEGVFVRFKELIPKGGENYWQNEGHKKMLVVGESNYLKDEFSSQSDFQDAEKWYTSPNAKLIPKGKEKDFDNWKGGYPTINRVLDTIKKVLKDAEKRCEDDAMQEIMFYNYFLRPASVRNGNYSFEKDCKNIDKEVAGVALCGIIEEIKPDLIVFLGDFAHKSFEDFIQANKIEITPKIEKINHPSHPKNWNAENGAKRFETIMREHWIKKK